MFCTPSFYLLICTKCYLVKNFKMFFQSNWISCSQYLQGYDDDCCQSYWYLHVVFKNLTQKEWLIYGQTQINCNDPTNVNGTCKFSLYVNNSFSSMSERTTSSSSFSSYHPYSYQSFCHCQWNYHFERYVFIPWNQLTYHHSR